MGLKRACVREDKMPKLQAEGRMGIRAASRAHLGQETSGVFLVPTVGLRDLRVQETSVSRNLTSVTGINYL